MQTRIRRGGQELADLLYFTSGPARRHFVGWVVSQKPIDFRRRGDPAGGLRRERAPNLTDPPPGRSPAFNICHHSLELTLLIAGVNRSSSANARIIASASMPSCTSATFTYSSERRYQYRVARQSRAPSIRRRSTRRRCIVAQSRAMPQPGPSDRACSAGRWMKHADDPALQAQNRMKDFTRTVSGRPSTSPVISRTDTAKLAIPNAQHLSQEINDESLPPMVVTIWAVLGV